MPQVNLIAHDNGAGLSRDLELTARALRDLGYDTTVATLGHRGRLRNRLARLRAKWHRSWLGGRFDTRYDVNIMLEQVRPELFAQARFNVLVPNPEWFRAEWAAELKKLDGVLAKTRHAERIFTELGCRTCWTGFTGEDNFMPDVARQPTFFHGPGRSGNKGTPRLLELWRQHPNWPQLTVVWRHEHAEISALPPNIVLIRDFVAADELRRLQNANLFHLCPSQTEGYGHYLAESLSVGAVVVTTDAEPMNELVTADRGLLVAARACGRQGLATLYDFDLDQMRNAVERCIAMPVDEQMRLGRAARTWFESNRDAFRTRLHDALAELPLASGHP